MSKKRDTDAKAEADLDVILHAMDGDISVMTLLTVPVVMRFARDGAAGDRRAAQIFDGIRHGLWETMHAKGNDRKLCACCDGVIEGIPGYPILVEVPDNAVGMIMLPTHVECSVSRNHKRIPGNEVLAKAFAMFKQHLHSGVRVVPAANALHKPGKA